MKHRLLALAAAGALSPCAVFSGAAAPDPDHHAGHRPGGSPSGPDEVLRRGAGGWPSGGGSRWLPEVSRAAAAPGAGDAVFPSGEHHHELRAIQPTPMRPGSRDASTMRLLRCRSPDGEPSGAAMTIAGEAIPPGSLQQTMADADALYNEALGGLQSARQSAEDSWQQRRAEGSARRSSRAEETTEVAAEGRPRRPRRWSRAYGGGEQDTAILAGTRAIQARVGSLELRGQGMKQKIMAMLTAGLLVLGLAGCGAQSTAQTPPGERDRRRCRQGRRCRRCGGASLWGWSPRRLHRGPVRQKNAEGVQAAVEFLTGMGVAEADIRTELGESE